ncbi:hypothetical protein AYR66_06410 [Noviherbaspirillum denitrificans]|uniref:HTH marR-type domain-containing protein n=2 Tax=Noviherbaspirillum denitrificans TaxID=1968433 RepID=A0A254TSL9_9BURK|nr:hypothetical protein AYR66_06410 [Noviherbaspirillum denitrificans]
MAGSSIIADDIRRFILTSIPSVPFLEAMLLLRNETGVAWDSTHLAKRLYLSDKAATTLLAELHAAGIAAPNARTEGGYCFHPASEALADIIGKVASAYAAHLVEVTHLIHSRSGKRAVQFADAFKWRKES